MILWAGGEDIDFPNGAAVLVSTSAPTFRSGYGRCSVYSNASGVTGGTVFSGGAIGSGWMHFCMQNSAATTGQLYAGVVSLTGAYPGIFVGSDGTTGAKLALYTWNGSSLNQVAAETGSSIGAGSVLQFDVNFTFGTSGTVLIYVGGNLVLSYSGNINSATGITTVNAVGFANGCGVTHSGGGYSEFIVADADTRNQSLVTMAPDAAGDTNNWTGAYSAIDPVAINDANVIYVNTTGQDFQANLIDLPSGTFSILGVKIAARAEVTAGATPTGLKLGVKTGGTINVGAANTLSASFATYERLLTTNPVTSAAWSASDINALQLDLQSA